MLTVRDIAEMDELGLTVVAGADGLANEVGWLHVSELEDPTPFLEGGEFLLTTGLGIGDLATTQRAYLRRLAKHGLAGLGFGVGFGFSDVPAAVVEEANTLGFPIVSRAVRGAVRRDHEGRRNAASPARSSSGRRARSR